MQNLGIIAGNGVLPLELAKIYQDRGGKCFIAGIEGEFDACLFDGFVWQGFKIGQVGMLIKYFKDHNVEQIIFAGGVKRPNIKNLNFDMAGAKLLAIILKQKWLGDDKLLKNVALFLEEEGFKVISAKDLLPENAKKDLILTKTKPSKQELVDIEVGIAAARKLGLLDIGQSVVIEDGYVLGVEAAEGTDKLIERCAILRKKSSGGVLVKIMKPGQDKRLDIPTIGPETIKNLVKNNYSGIAIEANGVIILLKEEVIALADQHDIFIAQF